ncbi:transporter substrate-binding domain-containing protein [Advenella mimigardefordensis]|uniref:Putative ABC transporter substrate-binding protein n=1 Tax=Advenella mimigardefordensis (strain DSM 17166 / LMG 22922 / DPN7) TaxID=1247726 RepID=W0PGY6_ADVMD|nr:transporter substrate-binding domain-containing protein [Advenella mimigardefordensis]AHG65107.1 putative ABC transporter substrate-binding protein [Advenella mimigardefordensis DPN7]
MNPGFNRKIGIVISATICTIITSNTPALAKDQLPTVPSYIAEKSKLNVGVRCDQPPYGFQDSKGDYAGVETDMARQLAQWIYGDSEKIQFSCVTAENRIPQLAGKRVDLLIATLGVTPERARVIDFSVPYRWGASGVLTRADSPVMKISELTGKTVAVPKGSVQAKWFEDNMPQVKTLRLNTAADSLQALKQNRADAYAHDAATLVVIAANDKGLRVVDDPYQLSDAAIGLRKNEPEWKSYLDAAVERMRSEKLFSEWVNKWVPEQIQPYYVDVFQSPRPDRK